MDSLEGKLGALLSDPNAMAQILSLAQNLGLGKSPPPDARPTGAPPPPQSAPSPQDNAMLQSLLQVMADAQKTDPQQEALFSALKPYLRPERREKLDRAAQLARLSRLAGAALGRMEHNA